MSSFIKSDRAKYEAGGPFSVCSDGGRCVSRAFPQFRRQMSFSISVSKMAGAWLPVATCRACHFYLLMVGNQWKTTAVVRGHQARGFPTDPTASPATAAALLRGVFLPLGWAM